MHCIGGKSKYLIFKASELNSSQFKVWILDSWLIYVLSMTEQITGSREGQVSQLAAGESLTLTSIWSRGESKDAPVRAPWSALGTGPDCLTNCGATWTSSRIPGSSAWKVADETTRDWYKNTQLMSDSDTCQCVRLTWWGSISSGTLLAAHCPAPFWMWGFWLKKLTVEDDDYHCFIET